MVIKEGFQEEFLFDEQIKISQGYYTGEVVVDILGKHFMYKKKESKKNMASFEMQAIFSCCRRKEEPHQDDVKSLVFL